MAAKKETAKEEDADKDPAVESDAEGDAAAVVDSLDGADKKFGTKKIIMFAALLVVLLIGTGAGLYFSGVLDGVLGKPAAEGEHGEAAKAGEEGAAGEHGAAGGEEGGHGEGAFLPIPTMIVNLASDDGTPRYLRLTVQLEMKSQEDLHAVEAVIPRVIDQFQTYLRELRVKDLRGSAGIYRLQMELLWRVNQAAAPVEVKDVLFQEILIQ